MDEVITPDLASLVCEQVRNYIICQGAALKTSTANGDAIATTTAVHPREISFTPLPREEKGYSDPEMSSQTTEESIAMDLAKLQEAFDRQVLYIIGKEQMKIKSGTGMWRKILLKMFLWLRDNTRTKIANLRVQPDRVIEMGFVKEV
jgi:KUP system potassium uptake protein